MSFTKFLRDQSPAKPAVSESTEKVPGPSKSTSFKRRRRYSSRIYKPLKIDTVIRPKELGSEETVGSSVLFSTKSATSYLKKKESSQEEDMQLSQSTLPSPPDLSTVPIVEDPVAVSPCVSPLPELPADLSFSSDPQMAELQDFENQLAATGLYPGETSEQVIQQYGGQPEVPGFPSSTTENERVVHLVNIARAVGVEVSHANHVLMKEMLDRQGKLNAFTVFIRWRGRWATW